MSSGTSEEGWADRTWLRDEDQVLAEFKAAGFSIWSGLARLLARRWDKARYAHRSASESVRVLADLAKFRCLPDGHRSSADAVLDALHFVPR